MYKGAFPAHLTRLLVEISDRWIKQNEIERGAK